MQAVSDIEQIGDQLRRDALSQNMRDIASAFVTLQEARHLADYDPATTFLPYDVSALLDVAGQAMQAFDHVDLEERRDVLALMLVGGRG